MNRRRKLLIAFVAGSLAAPLASFAQQPKVFRIGYLANDPDPRKSSNTFKAFVGALQKLGWMEGKNIEIRIKAGVGRDELYPQLAAEFVRESVDVIVTTGTASTRAAKAATDRIPIVFGSAANPVEQKFVESLARPGGNVTGVARLVAELGPKRLQLLKEMLPRTSHVARLYSGLNIVELQPAIMRDYESASRTLGVALQHIPVVDVDGIEAAFAAAAGSGVNGIIVEAEAVFNVNRPQVAALALKHRLPLMCADGRFADAGALAAYSDDIVSQYARAGFFVDKILRGAKPADIPVELPTVFELVVNLKTAEALGVTIPASVLARADRVIK